MQSACKQMCVCCLHLQCWLKSFKYRGDLGWLDTSNLNISQFWSVLNIDICMARTFVRKMSTIIAPEKIFTFIVCTWHNAPTTYYHTGVSCHNATIKSYAWYLKQVKSNEIWYLPLSLSWTSHMCGCMELGSYWHTGRALCIYNLCMTADCCDTKLIPDQN